MKMILTLCAAGALLASNSNNESPGPVNPPMGSVAGKVMFEGDRPKALPDLAPKEEELKGCHHDGHAMDKSDRTLLIDDKGGVANVVVLIEVKGAEVKPRTEPIVMDQRSCRFEPHVQVARVGETVRFLNSDGTNHNIHTYAKKNKNINNNVAGGSNYDMTVEKEEMIKIGCDIHPWMGSYLVVTEATHFAISKADGTFQIPDLPAGTYKAEYWHETLGKGKADVTVEEGKAASLEIKLSAAKKKKGGRRR
ncbi:MAG: carboxypeptidase regulatory-like domain-containing protein [Planctomycetota bacterium]